MALIENLEKGNWREFLQTTFDYTLDVLKNDRFRSVGSSVDDLRSWLACGGVSRVKEHLGNQMKQLRFEDWMYAQGHSYEEIVAIYRVIDQWLAQHGIISAPGALPPPRAPVRPSGTPETGH